MICRAILPAWGAGPYLPALVLERPIFVREVNDGLYTAFTYLTYKAIPFTSSLHCPASNSQPSSTTFYCISHLPLCINFRAVCQQLS